jgi:hypothetical protein
MRRALLAAVLLVSAALAAAASAPAAPQRILFIGNSLVSDAGLPERLDKLARAMGRAAVVESVAAPDFSLADHWAEGRALAAIRKGWDVVVLQQGPSARPESRAALVEDARRFAVPIRAAGAKPALLMVWPAANRAGDFPDVIRAYRQAAQAVDGILLPAGEAWLRVIAKDRDARLYGDALHPSSLGADLAVLAMYLTLFPAGPREFDDAFVEKMARALDLPGKYREPFVDAATRAIDEPMALRQGPKLP